MPSFDGGHYFFTALVPICNEGIVEHQEAEGTDPLRSSPVHMVREALETLPTALQTPATEAIGIQSPFARSTRTHFARFVVLDQPFYNGRDHEDALVTTVKGLVSNVDPLKAEPHDVLACPYLLVMIDFDPADPSGVGEPRAYLEHLWGVMAEELKAIFAYCYGFPQVKDAAGFAGFLLDCQIETTMPFNDYWTDAPPLKSLSVALLAIVALGGIVLAPIGAWQHWWSGQAAWVIGSLWLAAGLLVDYWLVMRKGRKPFPSSGATLPLVLKSLYLQQAFARFAGAQQDADPSAAAAAFRAFLEQHRPNELAGPTQKPGVIRTIFSGAGA